MILKIFRKKIVLSSILFIFFASIVDKKAGIEDKSIFIDPGDSVFCIAKKAFDIGLDYPTTFIITAFLYKLFFKIKTGEYLIKTNDSIIDFFKKNYKFDVVYRKLTIIEGLSTFEVRKLINETTYLKCDLIVEDAITLPETYTYTYGMKKSEIFNQMKNAMSKTLNDLIKDNSFKNSILKNKDEVLILASIVEKETGVEAERPLVASVFLNRLKIGMRLQSDPTTIFAITKGESKIKLCKEDLKNKSQYNTYYASGLPPKPICCPSKASIQAVLNPIDSKFLYFVANKEGAHVFSETYKEHLKNIKKIFKS